MSYYRQKIAAHVVLIPAVPAAASPLPPPPPPPAELHRLLCGLVLSSSGAVIVQGIEYGVQVYPSDARRIVERTQVSIGPSPGRLPEQLPSHTYAHEASVVCALLGLTSSPTSVLLSCVKGTGVKTLLRSVGVQPLLCLRPGDLAPPRQAESLHSPFHRTGFLFAQPLEPV